MDKEKNIIEQLIEHIWLNYFNQYLADNKVITEEEREQMSSLIEAQAYPHTA